MGGISSRRSTISRTTDDEAIPNLGHGTDPGDTGGSRQSSPRRLGEQGSKQKNVGVSKTHEEEEKIDHRKRKRNRTIRSCVPCHNHKRKVRMTRREALANVSVIESDLAGGVLP